MNDILEIINDLKEIREAVKNNQSFYIEIDRKIGKSNFSALAKASSPQGYQLTGFVACCKRYGLFSA